MNAGELLINTVQPTLHMHEVYAHELSADLDDHQMDALPGPGHENTPRFTIGHLCTGAALTRWVLENPDEDQIGQLDIPDIYSELFLRRGPADRRTPQTSSHAPSREHLIKEFTRQHQLLANIVRNSPDELLESPCTWKLGHILTRHADLVMFVCSHEALHLGQLASWRRAQNLPPAMVRMINGKPTS